MAQVLERFIEECENSVFRLKFWAVLFLASLLGGVIGNILYQTFMQGFCK